MTIPALASHTTWQEGGIPMPDKKDCNTKTWQWFWVSKGGEGYVKPRSSMGLKFEVFVDYISSTNDAWNFFYCWFSTEHCIIMMEVFMVEQHNRWIILAEVEFYETFFSNSSQTSMVIIIVVVGCLDMHFSTIWEWGSTKWSSWSFR